MRKLKLTMALAAGLLAAGGARANNLTVTNVTVKPLGDNTAWVQFDINWENSWRYTNINHDAAWVFFKVFPEGRTAWEHARLDGTGVNPAGYSTGTGTPVEIVVPDDHIGLFVRRAAEGSGAVSVTNVKAVWNFTSNSLAVTDRARLQVLAVEMVYVAEGSFQVGDGTVTAIRGQFEAGTNGAPFTITNEAYAITLGGGGAGSLGNNNHSGMTTADDFGDSTSQTLPADFPKGYAAFYCMKYELTQGQYRDFLNTLTRGQQIARTASLAADYFAMSANAAIQYRNGIRCPSSVPLAEPIVFGCDANANKTFNETNDAMDRACNYLSWADGSAFADWAGLRPMTELEFEKACRGPLPAVSDEYAWGDITISATTAIVNDGTGLDTATNGNCNYTGCSPAGPYRVGIYATTSSTRQSAGAGYYGAMELSGNLWERTVTVGHATGRLFTGIHGNGALTSVGNADVSNWPGDDASGADYRGGLWSDASANARVSDRVSAALVYAGRGYYLGWRAVRGAPSGVGP